MSSEKKAQRGEPHISGSFASELTKRYLKSRNRSEQIV
jgi:hypothetical protein